jgi:hypothetical protein
LEDKKRTRVRDGGRERGFGIEKAIQKVWFEEVEVR